ncbi:MAG: hypothetical protein LBH46_04030 [Rickettsiales bacterium]|jgi:hypothetical protein|nr:hypothetical protein [Rickettsiales bacterium]
MDKVKIGIALSSITTDIEINKASKEKIVAIVEVLNKKLNKLLIEVGGKSNDRFLLLILNLILLNKKHKVFSNFEENILNLLKKDTTIVANCKKGDGTNMSIEELLSRSAINLENTTKDLFDEIDIGVNTLNKDQNHNEFILDILNKTIKAINDTAEKLKE